MDKEVELLVIVYIALNLVDELCQMAINGQSSHKIVYLRF